MPDYKSKKTPHIWRLYEDGSSGAEPIKNTPYTWCIETLWGTISVSATETAITALSLPCDACNTWYWRENEITQKSASSAIERESPLITETRSQLNAYFEGRLKTFSLPVAPEGTEFQKRVWEAVCSISYGKTTTYGEIARLIGCPKGARAVGLANRCNPIPVIVPCHRVIGAKGKLTGYNGGLQMKLRLLTLEQNADQIMDKIKIKTETA